MTTTSPPSAPSENASTTRTSSASPSPSPEKNEKKWDEAIQKLDSHIAKPEYLLYLKDNGTHFGEILKGTVNPEEFVYKNYTGGKDKNALENWTDIMQAQNTNKSINKYLVKISFNVFI